MKKTSGQVAFDAYNLSRGGINHLGKPTPPWDELPEEIRVAWEAAATAVLCGQLPAPTLRAKAEPWVGEHHGHEVSTTDGKPPEITEGPAPKPVGPSGMHGSYWVLSEAERAKGFVRPVRQSYRHVGPQGPKNPLRDLTDEEKVRFAPYNYVKFEAYPESESSVTGCFWTQSQLDSIGKGCGVVTTMSLALAETYAREPKFYGATFCVGCKTHLPVAEFVWESHESTATEEIVGS